MKQFMYAAGVILLGLTSCKKNTQYTANEKMPRAVVKVGSYLTEISKTTGTTSSVVLVGGFGADLNTWEPLYKKLHRNTTVFTYNRAGLGMSQDIAGSRNASIIAREMKMVLEQNNIKPPYVLAAHSMGGIYARLFYHYYPALVKGIVLIDATHENQADTLLSFIPEPVRSVVYAEMNRVNDSIVNSMPAGSLKEEFVANFSENYNIIRTFPAITAIPLYVLCSVKPAPGAAPLVTEIHKILHQQWAAAAGMRGRFTATEKSGHFIQAEEPELVAEAIRWVLLK